jgi:hypothetical protein
MANSGFINAVRPAPALDDWTARLPPGSLPRSVRAGVDPRLELRPDVDPGYGMPNPPAENLNQDNSRATGFLNAAWPAGATAPAEPPDMRDRYNTKLTPEQEAAFQEWGRRMAAQSGGRSPADDTYDYDMRGFWAAANGDPKFADNGHAGDVFKKPNHPTFSDQSQYHGVDGYEGGTWGGGQNGEPWTFTPGRTNLETHGAEELQRYFDEREKGNTLILPTDTADLQS